MTLRRCHVSDFPQMCGGQNRKMVTLQYNAPSTSFDVFYLCLPWNVFLLRNSSVFPFRLNTKYYPPTLSSNIPSYNLSPTTSIDVVMLAVFLEKFALNDIATLPYSRFFPLLWEKITPRIFKFKNCFELSR